MCARGPLRGRLLNMKSTTDAVCLRIHNSAERRHPSGAVSSHIRVSTLLRRQRTQLAIGLRFTQNFAPERGKGGSASRQSAQMTYPVPRSHKERKAEHVSQRKNGLTVHPNPPCAAERRLLLHRSGWPRQRVLARDTSSLECACRWLGLEFPSQ